MSKVFAAIGYAPGDTQDTSNVSDWSHLNFTIDTDDPEGIWCDSEGDRPGSLLVGIGLVPHWDTPIADADELQNGAIYLDVTLEEIRALQKMLQRVIDDNTFIEDFK